jgi:hypothetical protein
MEYRARLPRLVIYPGERTTAAGVTLGTLYVLNGEGESYEVAGGPPPGKGWKDQGGHRAGITTPGKYVLGQAEHHVSENWPSSVVPWGAAIRDTSGIIEYQIGNVWKEATGPHGSVTKAYVRWYHKSNQPISVEEASKMARGTFFQNHRLVTTYLYNDFGKWSWNLKRAGHRTVFYIHTTPPGEFAYEHTGIPYQLEQSHGCIHIRPADRDNMKDRGYLGAGTEVEIMRYGVVGPGH